MAELFRLCKLPAVITSLTVQYTCSSNAWHNRCEEVADYDDVHNAILADASMIAICPVSMMAVPHKIRAQHNLNANYSATVERTAFAYVWNICTLKKRNVYLGKCVHTKPTIAWYKVYTHVFHTDEFILFKSTVTMHKHQQLGYSQLTIHVILCKVKCCKHGR